MLKPKRLDGLKDILNCQSQLSVEIAAFVNVLHEENNGRVEHVLEYGKLRC